MSELQTTPFPRRDAGWIAVRLHDGGQAELRPLGRGDTAPLLRVFEDMSENSRALRYLTGLPRLPRQMLNMLADVDGDRHVAWVASADGEPAGIARYVRVPGCPTTAEVAFEVVDRHHGRGLGTVLLDTITTVAAAHGVRSVQATVAPSNATSRRMLGRLGLSLRPVDGLLEAEGPLRLMDPPVVDRGAVVRAACMGAGDEALDIG